MTSSFNLLTERLFRLRRPGGERADESLPGVLAGLSSASISSFDDVMPHQKHAWHAFLVQLACLALDKGGQTELPAAESEWLELLRALSGNRDEPWSLIVPDLSAPAFMQPPVPEGSLDAFKPGFRTPDRLDVLVTAKNHDVKMARLANPRPAHWVFALITLQTMQGFSGKNNYGISRMNSGFGSRPCVALAPSVCSTSASDRFRRDVRVLTGARQVLLQTHTFYPPSTGLALLWLVPWDGLSSLGVHQLDPWYIEICRRVRMVQTASGCVARTRPTGVPRIKADDLKGNTGDAWTPLKSDGTQVSALTVPASGFSYQRLQEVLFQATHRPSLCQESTLTDPSEGMEILASVLVRGQGKTEGLHERRVPLPTAVRDALSRTRERDRLAARSAERVQDVATLARKVLRLSLLRLLQGAPEKLNLDDPRADSWMERFDREVDGSFFPMLWDDLSLPDEEARRRWRSFLVKLGQGLLRDAETGLPVPAARRFRAQAEAERYFHFSARKQFPEVATGGNP